jgi:hypothetical protein
MACTGSRGREHGHLRAPIAGVVDVDGVKDLVTANGFASTRPDLGRHQIDFPAGGCTAFRSWW